MAKKTKSKKDPKHTWPVNVDDDGPEGIYAEFVPDNLPAVIDQEDSLQLSSDEVRKNVIDLKDKIKDDYVDLCRLLYHIQKKQMYASWGFGTFDEYVAKEMEFEKSKARHLVQIWECLYERQADKGVFTKVMQLGWTKASKLIHVVNAENVEVWTEKGKYLSVENLVAEVKKSLEEKIPSDPSAALAKAGEVEGTNAELAIKTTTLQQHHDDYLATCQAVELVQNMQPGVSFSQAVALMARDFVATNPGEEQQDSREMYIEHIKKYEHLSNLQIVIIDPVESTVLYGIEHLQSLAAEVDKAELPPTIDIEEAFA